MNCLILIAFILAAFTAGRMGNRMYRYFDGEISFGAGDGDFRLVTYRSDRQLTRKGCMLLRVVENRNNQ